MTSQVETKEGVLRGLSLFLAKITPRIMERIQLKTNNTEVIKMTFVATALLAMVVTEIVRYMVKDYIHDQKEEELNQEILAAGGEIWTPNGQVRRAA